MNVCIFCGSSKGKHSAYASAAAELSVLLSQRKCRLVYGGGNIGIMGVLADSMLRQGAEVIGIIPEFLMRKEVGHKGITRLEVVASMHERKKRMAQLADLFIALPGGLGTLDELAEILTWKQLGLINVPVGLLNVQSFFDPLLAYMETMINEGFLLRENFDQLKISSRPDDLLTLLGVVAV